MKQESLLHSCILPAQFQPKGLYIHVPFCASRCPYCDFFVIVSREESRYMGFVQRILEQLDSYLKFRPQLLEGLDTVFLGGGTPSLLGARALSYLLKGLNERLKASGHRGLGDLVELSMESNPELIHAESLQLWQSLGINRLSIGLQSCNDSLLKLLGRRSSQQAQEKLAKLLAEQFVGEYSFDFMYGLPGQTLQDIEDSMDFIRCYQPHHVSYYELGIEEDTLFRYWQEKAYWEPPDAEQNEQQFSFLCSGLERLGYERYEVSNFARLRVSENTQASQKLTVTQHTDTGNSRRRLYSSCHNKIYWCWQPYLGLGPSAVGAALLADSPEQTARIWRMQGVQRGGAKNSIQVEHSYLQDWDFGVRFVELSPEESFWEYLLMALRLRRGIDACEFTGLFWPQRPVYGSEAARLQLEELLGQMLPKSMAEFGQHFYWKEGCGTQYLRLSERGFDLQGLFLRTAYLELGL